jgi:predicted tellurium resistance membrane protein TerC
LPAVIRHDTVADLDRFPTLVYLRAALLAYLAVEMFFADVFLHHYLEPYASIEWIVGIVAALIFAGVAWLWTRRSGGSHKG